MAKMTGNGWTLVVMARNGWKWLKVAERVWKLQKKWLKMAGNGDENDDDYEDDDNDDGIKWNGLMAVLIDSCSSQETSESKI